MASEFGLRVAQKLWGWQPHSTGQMEWMLCDAKVRVGACGRRWGKSESIGVDVALYALEHPHTSQFVLAPTDDQTKIIMEEVSRRLHAIPGMTNVIDEKKSPFWSIKLIDGTGLKPQTSIQARTLGVDGKGLRGHKAHRVIIDEVDFAPQEVLQRVVPPMLLDYDGDLVLISSPNGRRYFYRQFLAGQDISQDRVRSFRFPSSDNPYLSRAYLEHERKTRPDRIFRIEYLAEFLDDDGSVFRGVRDCVGLPVGPAQPDYVLGVDWGRSNDYTVITALDSINRRVVEIDRFNQIDYHLQLGRLQALAMRYQPTVIVAESNSMGQPLIEQMQRLGLPVQGFTTTNPSKAVIIEALALALETHNLSLVDDEVLINELEAYSHERLAGGMIRYGAPEGLHDDCVMSLALAWYAGGQQISYAPGIWG